MYINNEGKNLIDPLYPFAHYILAAQFKTALAAISKLI